MRNLETVSLVALDIDGVALPDTFSPVIYTLVKKWGGEYSREVERNVFSQSRKNAANYLIKQFALPHSTQEVIELYFKERDAYLQTHPNHPVEGLRNFLQMLKSLNLKIICYGGLDILHFQKELMDFLEYFDEDKYICTNDFRPGIKEIVKDFYNLEYSQVLFIDDVNKVAEEAKEKKVPFIGVPSNFEYGFQRQDMITTGVKYLVYSIGEINENMIQAIDREAKQGHLWNEKL